MDFFTHIKSILNEYYDNYYQSLNDEPYSGIYFNDRKYQHFTNKNIFNNLTKHPIIDSNYIFKKSEHPLGKNVLFDLGLYYIQEPSAMLVSYLLDINENDKVIDLCAAPGGKSCFALNKAKFLLANDYSSSRSNVLSENIERMGFKNVLVTNNEVSFLKDHYYGQFDKVILDAPCSGEGMFRKNNDVFKDWSLEKVESLVKIQKQLIIDAYQLLKKDGIMVYSTCTYELKENEEIINYLLSNTNASLITIKEINGSIRGFNQKEAIRLIPPYFKGEGHFIALIKCNDEHQPIKNSFNLTHPNKQQLKLYKDFEKKYLVNAFNEKNIIINNNHLHLIDDNFVFCKGLKIKRSGLHLGEIKKDRFIPSFALSRYLNKEDFKEVIELDEEQVSSYLKGNTLNIKTADGYKLLTYQNIPVSFAKASNNILKNHYPKGLRKNQ
ncbi:MAG: RsmF rRNA methyltransferase first C-terminal domain-containing protein [Bacilli bacterium]|nr:RsmF rRNA methyltransferase first C-terminal domain-containing protein [Bacilli bacterium]